MATAIEALLEACERRSGEVGILTLRDQVNKSQALFYLNNGGVYAIEVDTYDPPVKTRLMRTGRIDMESDLDSAISSVGGEKSLQLPALIVQRQIADEYDVALIIKDFFLEAASEVLSWENVKVSWRKGFVYNEYPIPPLEGGKLVEIVASRSVKFQQVAKTFQVSPERVFEDASVLVSPKFEGQLNKPEETAIYYAVRDTHQKIGDLMIGLGLTRVSVMKHVYSLWHAGAIDIYVNGINISEEEEETEEELSLEFMQTSDSSPDSPVENSNKELPQQTLPTAPQVAPVYVDEPIDSFSPSSAIPANPELTFDDTPRYIEEPTNEDQAFNITSMESEEASAAAEEPSVTEEQLDEPSNRYGNNDEEEVVELDFDYAQNSGQYAASPESDEETLSFENDFQQADNAHDEESIVPPPPAPISTAPDNAALRTPEVAEPLQEETVSPERSIQEETTEITQQVDEEVEKTQESVNAAQESTPSEGGHELLTEMQSMLAKINSAVGESTQTLSLIAQQIEENSETLTKVRKEKDDLENKITELTQGLERVKNEEARLTEHATELDKKYQAEKDKVDEFTRGLDSLRSMFNG